MDQLEEYLKAVKAPKEAKAQAWDFYQSAADADELAKHLSPLDIPKEAKARLWDLKAQAPSATIEDTAQQQVRESAPAAGGQPSRLQSAVRSLLPGDPMALQGAGVLGMANVGKGFAKDLGGTVLNMIRTMRGNNARNPLMGGDYFEGATIPPPEGTPEKVGAFLSSAAQYAVPSMGAAKVTSSLPIASKFARMLMGAGGQAAASGATDLARTGEIDPVNVALSALTPPAVAGASALAPTADSAVSTYQRAMIPNSLGVSQRTRELAARVVPELIARKKWVSSLPALLENSNAQMAQAGQEMDLLFQAQGQKVVDTVPITDALTKIRDQFFNTATNVTIGPNGQQLINVTKIPIAVESIRNIDHLIDLVKRHGNAVSMESVVKLRRNWDDIVTRGGTLAFGRKMQQGVPPELLRDASNAVRAALADQVPDLAKINAEWSLWKGVQEIVTGTIERKMGKGTPLYQAGAGMAVAAASNKPAEGLIKGTLAKLAVSAFQSPWWRTFSAIKKDELAQAIATGKVEAAEQILRAAAMGLHQTPEPQP